MRKNLIQKLNPMKNIVRGFMFALLLPITGCNSVTPVVDTFNALTGLGKNPIIYQPQIEYLEVSVGGRKAYMALGYRTFPKPTEITKIAELNQETNQLVRFSSDQRIHEYWYSSRHEMLELVDGRIESVMGMTTEWRQSLNTSPSWNEIATSNGLGWTRVRDVMPNYQFGLNDSVYTAPLTNAPPTIKDIPNDAQWFKELVESRDKLNHSWKFTQVFARYKEKVIYSEQCIAPDLCLQMKYLGFTNSL